MKIDKRLNIVVGIENNAGDTFYVHSTPISTEVFEQYFVTIAKVFSFINGEGMGIAAGPRVAALTLEKLARADGIWDGDTGVRNGLLEEIKRLSNVVILREGGWQTMPLDTAIKADLISAEDLSEVMNILVFFTVNSAMHRRTVLPGVLAIATSLWGAQITSLDSTEFARSLPKSTETDSSGAKVAGSSLPS